MKDDNPITLVYEARTDGPPPTEEQREILKLAEVSSAMAYVLAVSLKVDHNRAAFLDFLIYDGGDKTTINLVTQEAVNFAVWNAIDAAIRLLAVRLAAIHCAEVGKFGMKDIITIIMQNTNYFEGMCDAFNSSLGELLTRLMQFDKKEGRWMKYVKEV